MVEDLLDRKFGMLIVGLEILGGFLIVGCRVDYWSWEFDFGDQRGGTALCIQHLCVDDCGAS